MRRKPYMRNSNAWLMAIFLTVTAGGAAQAPDADRLARFVEKVRQDLTAVRDCNCLETIERGRRRPPHNDFAPVDTIRLEVSTIAGKELFASPGRRFDSQIYRRGERRERDKNHKMRRLFRSHASIGHEQLCGPEDR